MSKLLNNKKIIGWVILITIAGVVLAANLIFVADKYGWKLSIIAHIISITAMVLIFKAVEWITE